MRVKPQTLKIGQTITAYQSYISSTINCIISNITEIKKDMFLIEFKNNGRPLNHLDVPIIVMKYQDVYLVTIDVKIKGLERYLLKSRKYKQAWLDEIKAKSTNKENYFNLLEKEDSQCQSDSYESLGEQRVRA